MVVIFIKLLLNKLVFLILFFCMGGNEGKRFKSLLKISGWHISEYTRGREGGREGRGVGAVYPPASCPDSPGHLTVLDYIVLNRKHWHWSITFDSFFHLQVSLLILSVLFLKDHLFHLEAHRLEKGRGRCPYAPSSSFMSTLYGNNLRTPFQFTPTLYSIYNASVLFLFTYVGFCWIES